MVLKSQVQAFQNKNYNAKSKLSWQLVLSISHVYHLKVFSYVIKSHIFDRISPTGGAQKAWRWSRLLLLEIYIPQFWKSWILHPNCYTNVSQEWQKYCIPRDWFTSQIQSQQHISLSHQDWILLGSAGSNMPSTTN